MSSLSFQSASLHVQIGATVSVLVGSCFRTREVSQAHLTAEDKADVICSSLFHDVIWQGGHIGVVTPV